MSLSSTKRRFLRVMGPCALLGFFVIFRSHFFIFYNYKADLQSNRPYSRNTARNNHHRGHRIPLEKSIGIDFDVSIPPQFHGCNDKNLCVVSNVCFSNEDGILLFVDDDGDQSDTTTTATTKRDSIYEQFAPLFRQPLDPWKAKILPPKEYYQHIQNSNTSGTTMATNIHYAHHALVAPCYRRFAGDFNPAHFLFSQGRIFAASTNIYDRQGVPFDAIVQHQCAAIDHWEWGQLVHDMVLKYAEQTGTLCANKHYKDINLPFRGKRTPKQLEREPYLRKGDTLVCTDKAYIFSPDTVGPYFVKNDPKVVQEWKTYVANTLPSLQEIKSRRHHKRLSEMEPQECRSNARTVIWQRSDGTALRRFVNVDEVQTLAQEFAGDNTFTTATTTSANDSGNPIVPIVIVNASTSALEQIELFNSFDIFITPHGSHLTNMMFTDGQSAFIELAAVPYDFAPFENGKSFAKHWILSYGHKPYERNDLLEPKLWDECLHNRNNTPLCTIGKRVQYIQSDIVVNTTILRANLKEALDALCSETTTTS